MQFRIPTKHVGLLLLLALLLLLDNASSPLRLALRVATNERPLACPLAVPLGPYGAYLDACELPLLHRHGGVAHAQQTSHEGQADLASWLYAADNRAVIFDDAGPVCVTRVFFAVGFSSLNAETNPHRGRLAVEVDGVITLEGSVEELFMRGPWAPAGFGGGGGGGEALAGRGHPALPPALSFNIERAADGTLHSGYILQAPICAAKRLRVSLSFPEMRHAPQRFATIFIQDAWLCVAAFEPCPVSQYFNVAALRFPATLPPGWGAWNGSAAAPRLPAPHAALFSGARALREARAAGAGADAAGSGVLAPGAPPLLLLERASGGGVITALTLAFANAPRLLHSRRVLLRGVWDEGGCGPPHAWGAPLPPEPPAGAPVAFTAWGFADGEGPEPPPRPPACAGGRGATLEVDLEALLGPTVMGDQETPALRKELLHLGEAPPGEVAGEPELRAAGGLYLTLPMPFWRAARLTLQYTGTAAEFVADAGGAAAAAAGAVAWRLSVAPPSAAGEGAVGYLQGGVRAFDMVQGMKANVLAQATGVRGKLVFISARVNAGAQNFVEGDVRVWVDGSPTPTIWDSGWEDFFGSSHGYAKCPHQTEPLFAWDRVDPPGWGVDGANKHTRVDFWQQRLFGLDAPTFAHGFRAAVEGLPNKYHGSVRAMVLFYGVPAPPLKHTDRVLPGEELPIGAWPLARGPPPHGYAVAAPPDDVTVYALRSALPSYGELVPILQHKCFRKGHCLYEGTTGGVPLTRDGALALRSGRVAFTVAVDPSAVRVYLRRLVDVRFPLQRAALSVDGHAIKVLQSSDKDFAHMDTAWKVDTYALPEEHTRGKSALRLALEVEPAAAACPGCEFPSWPGNKGGAAGTEYELPWVEAQWDVYCEMPLGY